MEGLALSDTIPADEFGERLLTLHQQVFASEPPAFDQVTRHIYRPPPGCWLADHCLVWDGANWHLFYVTGRHEFADLWIAAIRAGHWDRAQEIPYEMGDAHAVGPTLQELRFESFMLTAPQGEFGIGGQMTSNITRWEDGWINVYTGRGPEGQCLCVARSKDLFQWEMDASNPVWRPPAYALPRGVCKNAHVMPYQDGCLIYYCLTLLDGLSCVALLSTCDFHTFQDHGPVFKMPPQLRGTGGLESPCVVHRHGMWHLFVPCGTGVWHAVSSRPDSFLRAQAVHGTALLGTYLLGHFHAAEVFDHEGRWYMTTTRKEEQRRLNRQAGVLKFRGSAADEAVLMEGLYLATIEWRGDQPILQAPADVPGR